MATIKQAYVKENPCYKAGKNITVKGLMLHSVGCAQPNAEVFVNAFNKSSYNSACVHAFIDGNTGTVYQTLPWNMRGWHAGGAANDTHIGVEMCEPNCIKYTTGANFTCSDINKARKIARCTYDSAVTLFAILCKEFKLDPMADGVIISHREGNKRGIASGHVDPEHLWQGLGLDYTMKMFREDVKAALQLLNTGVKSNKTYRVQTGAFTNYDNATAYVKKLKAAGFDAFIVEDIATATVKTSIAGDKVQLSNAKLYISTTAKEPALTVSGTYYYWDSEIVNGRRRITNKLSNVGKSNAVTGWIDN